MVLRYYLQLPLPAAPSHRDQSPSSIDALPAGLGLLPWRPLCRNTAQDYVGAAAATTTENRLEANNTEKDREEGEPQRHTGHRPQVGCASWFLGKPKSKAWRAFEIGTAGKYGVRPLDSLVLLQTESGSQCKQMQATRD